MDDTFAVKVVDSDQKLTNDKCRFEFVEKSTFVIKVRKQVTARDKVLEDVSKSVNGSTERAVTDVHSVRAP